MRESLIEKTLVREVKKLGGKCIKMTVPGEAGFPDRQVLLPNVVPFFVETKATGKTERRLQELRQQELRNLGLTVYSSVDSVDKVMEIIEKEKNNGKHNNQTREHTSRI